MLLNGRGRVLQIAGRVLIVVGVALIVYCYFPEKWTPPLMYPPDTGFENRALGVAAGSALVVSGAFRIWGRWCGLTRG